MKCGKPVDVICQFCRDGSMIPLKLRVQDEEQAYQTYTIKSYKALISNTITLPSEQIVTSSVARFDCKIEVLGMERRIVLHYNKAQMLWLMYY